MFFIIAKGINLMDEIERERENKVNKTVKREENYFTRGHTILLIKGHCNVLRVSSSPLRFAFFFLLK